jgi:hypothetical protein
MKSRRRGLGRSSPKKGASFFSDPGRRRMAKRESMPRKSPSGGSISSQGRFKISGEDEAMTRKRGLPEGKAALIFSQEAAQEEGKELGSQGGLGSGVEERGEASGDLPHCLRVLSGEALVGEDWIAVEGDVEEVSGVGRCS